MRKYTSLDPNVIKSEYPKSYEKFKEWFYGEDKLFAEEQDEPPLTSDEKDKFTTWAIQFNARLLYDFFDDMEIYISIEKWAETFIAKAGELEYEKNPVAKSRNEVEEEVFILAFKKLENKLQ